jgi:hypothetical protein
MFWQKYYTGSISTLMPRQTEARTPEQITNGEKFKHIISKNNAINPYGLIFDHLKGKLRSWQCK